MPQVSAYTAASRVIVDQLAKCGYQACRVRLLRFKTREFNDEEPIVVVTKGQVTRSWECRGRTKRNDVRISIGIQQKDTDCQVCDEEETKEDKLDWIVQDIHDCLCDFKPDADLLGDYGWGGWVSDSEELDDQTTEAAKRHVSSLDMTFRLCHTHEPKDDGSDEETDEDEE